MRIHLLLATCIAALAATPAFSQSCTPIGGTYSLTDGSTPNAATGSGPWTLTATNSTASYVLFNPAELPTFAQVQSLSATFTSNSGGAAAGSPRLSVMIDMNDNGVLDAADKNVVIYLGTSPSFVDTDASLNTWSGQNVIGNNDAGRYDTSHLPGGSPSTTYSGSPSSALTLAGPHKVLQVGFIEDTFSPYPDRNLTLNSIDLCAQLADLTITKTVTSPTNGVSGQAVTYTLTVNNVGTADSAGTVTVTDTPTSTLTINTMTGTGWSCDVPTATCTRSDVLPAGQSFPPINVTATTGSTGSADNTATVSGGGDLFSGNNSSTVTPPVPTMSGWTLLLMAAFLSAAGFVVIRRG